MSSWHTADWLSQSMHALRELQVAYRYLDSRPYAAKNRHELWWPLSLLQTEIRGRQDRISAACAPWFEVQS